MIFGNYINKKVTKEFRIAEYNDGFHVQRKFTYKEKKYFGLASKENYFWHGITKQGCEVCIRNWQEKLILENKEDAIKWIDNYLKYPIYHDYKK